MTGKTFFKHILLMGLSIVMGFPFVWMLMGAFKTNYEIWNEPFKLIPNSFDWSVFYETLTQAPFIPYIFNSVYTSLAATILVLINSAMFAYAVTKIKFKGSELLFWIVIGIYMLPVAVTYVPGYIILSRMGLLDSHIGLIISWAASVFGVFYFRQNFIKINDSLIDAARIDGSSEWQVLWNIIFPNTRACFITLGILTFIGNYNSYMWPSLVMKSKEKTLISNGLIQFFFQEGGYGMNWSKVMVGSTLTIMPLVIGFVVLQKWFVTSINDTGVKE
ncbi:MAG: conserved rane protein of unknown function [Clostridia bacterium]|nr:conserved rane protein of unknown function [Clostridia bacterium]